MLRSPATAFAGACTLCILLSTAALTAAEAAEKTCLDCHKKLISKRSIHPAISQFAKMEQGCPVCHESPHGKKKGSKSLTGSVPDLCFPCHDKGRFTKTVVHQPVAGGDCSLCHNPHATDAPSLLTQPVPYLCHSCHDDKKDGMHILAGYGSGDKHPVLGRKDPHKSRRELSCVSCHNPHSSTHSHLFTSEEAGSANLCLQCHHRITVRQ